jgi:hypothetical protein
MSRTAGRPVRCCIQRGHPRHPRLECFGGGRLALTYFARGDEVGQPDSAERGEPGPAAGRHRRAHPRPLAHLSRSVVHFRVGNFLGIGATTRPAAARAPRTSARAAMPSGRRRSGAAIPRGRKGRSRRRTSGTQLQRHDLTATPTARGPPSTTAMRRSRSTPPAPRCRWSSRATSASAGHVLRRSRGRETRQRLNRT